MIVKRNVWSGVELEWDCVENKRIYSSLCIGYSVYKKKNVYNLFIMYLLLRNTNKKKYAPITCCIDGESLLYNRFCAQIVLECRDMRIESCALGCCSTEMLLIQLDCRRRGCNKPQIIDHFGLSISILYMYQRGILCTAVCVYVCVYT